MWFKKKANIIGYNPNTAVDGTDWRTNGNGNSWSVSQTLPSAADANNYFYLPALGYYNRSLIFVGAGGYYWSSSAYSWNSEIANCLNFDSDNVNVMGFDRDSGFRAEALFE